MASRDRQWQINKITFHVFISKHADEMKGDWTGKPKASGKQVG